MRIIFLTCSLFDARFMWTPVSCLCLNYRVYWTPVSYACPRTLLSDPSNSNTKTPAAGKKLILHTTLHIGTPTTATAWSHDNSLLAVVGEHGRIGLWRMAAVGEKVGEEPSEVLDHAAWVAASGGHGSSDTTTASSTGTGSTSDISSLHFIGRSRYLLVLNRHRCAVDVYDLHRSVWRRVFRFDQDKMIRPQWLSVNTDDSVVAVGGVDTRAGGAALAFMQWPPVASATSALVQPALTFEAPLAQLQFSSFRRSMVCCALEDGNVHLVHTGSSSASGSSSSTASTSSTAPRILHTFHTHGQTVTGLCFSPNNRFLMGTVGLDARLVLYDVEKLVAVRTIQCAAPLVGLSFHSDGVVLVYVCLWRCICALFMRSISL